MLCDRFIRNFGRLGPQGQPTEILLNDVVQQVDFSSGNVASVRSA